MSEPIEERSPCAEYERVVLFVHRDTPIIGKATREEVAVLRCKACAALVQVDHTEAHDEYHDRIDIHMRHPYPRSAYEKLS